MHILFLTDNFSPEVNAAASRVYERACYWVKAGHEVTVITSAPNFPQGKVHEGYKNEWRKIEEMDGIRVVRVKTFIAPNEGTVLRVIDFISYMFMAIIMGWYEETPDVIIATSPQFFTAIAGWLLALAKRKPFVFELSDLWPASIVAVGAMEKNIFIRAIEKLELFLYKQAKLVVSLTKAFKEDLVSRGIDENKIAVVRNGVDLTRYRPTKKDSALISQYHLKDKFVVAYIGTQGMAHQLSNVLNAANLAQNQAEDKIHFLFVGDGAEHQQLVRKTEEGQLKNVTFIPSQAKSEILRYWSICDLALVHLKNDPVFSTVIPSKMFEAMAMSLPIMLVSPRGEAADILEEDQAGIWVPAGDPELFLKAVKDLMRDATKLKFYQEKSLNSSLKHSRQSQAEEIIRVLKTII